jgi:type I restriction enzyme S subunit
MSEWRLVRVAEVAADRGLIGGPFGSSLGSKDYVHSGVPVIRGVNLGSQRKFDDSEFVYVTEQKANGELARNLAIPGDVIFTQRGTLGQVGIVPAGRFRSYVVSQSQMRLRVNQFLATPEFIYYQFRSPEMVAAIHNRAIATGVPHINLSILGSLEIRLPPLKVQRFIAATLESLDTKISINERIIRTAMELSSARFSAVPEWVSMNLGTIAEVFDGPHATPTPTDDGPWFLGISSLRGGVLDLDASSHLSEDDFSRWTRRVQPRVHDVLFSYETRLGEAALMLPGIRASLGRRMGLLRARTKEIPGVLLLHAFLSKEFQEEIRRRSIRGATVDRIPLKDLPDWPILLPARTNCPALLALLEPMHEQILQLVVENRALHALRDSLLPELMSGRLRARDAEKVLEDVV